jgi:nickel-dependent lactate racemase
MMSRSSAFEQEDPLRPQVAVDLNLPSDWHVDVASTEPVEPLADPHAAVAAALADPLNTPPLSELVGPGDQVCIAFTHPSTLSPDHILVPALLRELEAAGVRDEDITLLCATGLYGRTRHEEKLAQLGSEVVERYRVIDHDVSEVIHLGSWQGIPLTVNRRALEADLLISTGNVAPHLYAGYSGGADTVAVGCAGDTTIEAIHAPAFLYNPYVRPGQVRGNPFQETLQIAAERSGLRFIVNTVLDPAGRIVAVQAGDPAMVHQHLVFSASSLYNVPVPGVYDVVIAQLGPTHDTSLYEAVLAALLIGLAPNPVVRPGGVIVLPARIPEAIGREINAQNFFNALQGARSLDRLVSELLEKGYRPGEGRAFQLARLLEQNDVIVVGSEFPAIVEASHLQQASNMLQAVDLIHWSLGDNLRALVVPHALYTLPIPPTTEPDGWYQLSLTDTRPW